MATGPNTLGLTRLAQTWVRRLGQCSSGDLHDALVVTQGPAEVVGGRFELDRSAQRILVTREPIGLRGLRGPTEPIQLPSPYVSEPHAALEPVAQGWCIVDLGSSNHTYVGTVKVASQLLVYGDEIRLGDVVLVYVTAERAALPPHAVDEASGLLDGRVFVAEATRLLVGASRPALLLLRIDGLRGKLSPDEVRPLLRRVGRTLLSRWRDGVLLGRLETDLFAAVFSDLDRDELRAEAEGLLRALRPLLPALGLRARAGVVAAPAQVREATPVRVPRMLACLLGSLDQAPGGAELVEADLDLDASLLGSRALLRALVARPELSLLLLTIEDEDRLRHHLGHDRLAACRWQLARLVARGARGAPLLGVLEQRLLVVGLGRVDEAEHLARSLQEQFRAAMAGQDEAQLYGLRWATVTTRPAQTGELRRALLEAVEGSEEPGPREPVDLLPTPVAAPYSLIWVVVSPTARVKTMLDCAEVVTRFVTVAALAAAAELDRERTSLRRQVAGRRRRLPLGEWVALLRELAPALRMSDNPVTRQLCRALGIDGRGVRFAHLLERELLPQRNRFAHGELAPQEQRSAEQAALLLAPLNELVRSLGPLTQLQLLTVVSSSPRRSGGARATVRVHTGPRENFEVRQVDVRTSGPLFPGSTYLMTADYRDQLELSPLVRLQLCPRCDREELFVADALTLRQGEPLELGAVSTGHRARFVPVADDIPRHLADLLSTGQTGE